MAVNKLLPFANGAGANVPTWDDWSALTTLLGQGFVTGIARSDYANRVFSQGALASYVLGQLVVDQIAQDADLDEATFYTNFKNALKSYIEANAVALTSAQTVGGVKTFTSSPVVPTKTTGDSSTNAASTAFVQTEIANQAVKYDSAQTLTNTQKKQARDNVAAAVNTVYPIGSYLCFAGNTVPTGYLLCNGAAVSRTTYAALFAVIGTTYGSGDGSTTFNLPNADGRVLQGVSDLTKVGNLLNSQLPDITGGVWGLSGTQSNNGQDSGSGATSALYWDNNAYNVSASLTSSIGFRDIHFSASRNNAIYGAGSTVQNPAIQALIAIRYE